MNKIIILTLKECYRDGGSKLYKDGDGKEYYLDGGIFSKTQGVLFLGNEASHEVEAVGTYQLTDKREIITQKLKIVYKEQQYNSNSVNWIIGLSAALIISLLLVFILFVQLNAKI